MESKIVEIETSLTDTGARLDDVVNKSLPSIADHILKISTALNQRILDMDVHARKWHLTIQGLTGEAGEKESITREKCLQLASDIGVPGAHSTHIAACHRLSGNANAGVIIRFCDLDQRDDWLRKAPNLRNAHRSISFSPDLPPVLRPLKTKLLEIRKTLPSLERSKTRIKYMKVWPYVKLMYKDQSKPDIVPTFTKEQVLGSTLGFDPRLCFKVKGE